MVLITGLILAIAFILGCGKILKKHSTVFYIIAVVLSLGTVALSFIETRTLPLWLNNYVLSLLTKSGFASSLWIIVMWAGALKNGSWAIKKIMPIRGELSIIASILTLGHNIGYGKTYFIKLFTAPQSIPTNYLIAAIISLIMIFIMVPLTIISFPKIRKKMSGKRWKSIQRFAYLFYAFMYAHTMLLYIPMAQRGNNIEASINIVLYSLIFILYAGCRIRKFFIVKKKATPNIQMNVLTAVAVCVLVCSISVFAYPLQRNNNIVSVNTNSLSTKQDTATEISTHETTTEKVSEAKTEKTTQKATEKNSEKATEKTTNKNNQKATEKATEKSTKNSTQNSENNTVVTYTVVDNNEQQVNEQQNVDTQQQESLNNSVEIPDNSQSSNQNISQGSTSSNNSGVNNNVTVQTPPVEVVQPTPNYIYNNGKYTAKAYGYDGDVEVTITIENDVITSIDGISQESDNWYFDNAKSKVFNEIISLQQPNVDACSGATFSSNAIMQAVQTALNSARK